MKVHTLKEGPRGCGYRKAGATGVGIYLMADGIFEACERLPFPLRPCDQCKAMGIRCSVEFSRAFTWIEPSKLFNVHTEPVCDLHMLAAINGREANKHHQHSKCFMCAPPPKQHGLLWVGEKFYTPESFIEEARLHGISKRLPNIPRGFKLGETVVYMAHARAVIESTNGRTVEELVHNPPARSAGVFFVVKPTHIDLVVDSADHVPERAQKLKEQLGDMARLVTIEKQAEWHKEKLL